jgi:hypothetical protein
VRYYLGIGIFMLLLGIVYVVLWPVFMYKTIRLMCKYRVSYTEARYAVNSEYFIKAMALDLED